MFPPGHFYSPIPAIDELERDRARIFGPPPRQLPGIDLDDADQLALVQAFGERYYADMPFQDQPVDGLRYGFGNGAYSYTDAIFLHCMIRHAQPRRIIEVGSGHSSCVTMDTNERFFGGGIECTFIEPYPKLLHSLLKPTDAERIRIIGTRVQDVATETFDVLESNDILFIDSTHVSKTGSDVNYLFFEVIPRLKPGVLIHVHDIFYPFEYPEKWALAGRAWNENYLLRAFLQFNSDFKVVLFANYLVTFHRAALVKALPKCAGNFGGNIWFRRV
ncbi:MAG: class I SAM-dependent methyltransferase [Burkholderiaceae bacterium]|nr:class I SAM-dependent methyltransferase [Burkholderiaceae bacterium]